MRVEASRVVSDYETGVVFMQERDAECIHCGHVPICGGQLRIEFGRAFQSAYCAACDRSWIDSLPQDEALAFLQQRPGALGQVEEPRHGT